MKATLVVRKEDCPIEMYIDEERLMLKKYIPGTERDKLAELREENAALKRKIQTLEALNRR